MRKRVTVLLIENPGHPDFAFGAKIVEKDNPSAISWGGAGKSPEEAFSAVLDFFLGRPEAIEYVGD